MAPKLAAPGAGLPLLELLLLRYVLVPRESRRSTWEGNARRFETESEKILALVGGLPEETLTRKVLIPRLRGLEDSSRHWSLAMTLEHLFIVGTAMKSAIVELTHGRVPERTVGSADVKPSRTSSGRAAVASFEAFTRAQIPAIEAGASDKASKARYPHPWFGPLTAHQWMWLMALHQGLHRKQLKEILARMA